MHIEPVADSSLFINSIIFIASLIVCAIFSFLETSITSMRLFKLKELASSTRRYKALFEALETNPHRMLTTILVATSFASVTTAASSTEIIEVLCANLSPTLSFVINIAFTTIAILIFGEILPKNIAKVHGEQFFKSTLWISNVVFYALYPLVTLLVKLADYVVYKVGNHTGGTEYVTSEKEIQFLIDYVTDQGLIDREKTVMLKSVFELGITGVREIMVPLTSVILINVEMGTKEALDSFKRYQFSRFPIYENDTNNIIGMLHLKDLFVNFSKDEDKPIRSIIRPILFIPESLKVNQLLKEFKTQHMHIAMVLNEHGSIIGMVTLEDVLEEIVGEIRDEHESITEKITALKPGGWIVDATIELEELEDTLNITFTTENALTLAGFLTEQLHHLPKKGERLLYKGYNFQIQQASVKRVHQVLIFVDTLPEILETTD